MEYEIIVGYRSAHNKNCNRTTQKTAITFMRNGISHRQADCQFKSLQLLRRQTRDHFDFYDAQICRKKNCNETADEEKKRRRQSLETEGNDNTRRR